MSTAELKSTLHRLIDRTDDSTILSSMYAFYSKLIGKATITLTNAEKKAVDQALKSIQNSNSSSHEQVMAEMKQKYPGLLK
jgi:hypothetical protein